jgi:hypothetical protein
MNIDKFKQDHVSILSLVSKLRTLVQAGVGQNAGEISRLIVTMSSAIKLHLSAEDRMLYPKLLKSEDPGVVNVAKKFQTDMGGIAAAYMAFVSKWNVESKVSVNPDGFKKEANDIFKALHQRMQHENTELYVMAENI